MPDVRQLVLLAIVLLTSAYLIINGRESALVKWICIVVAIDVFDPKVVVNLPAARVAGLLLLPSTLAAVRTVLRNRPGKALFARYMYLALLGLLFGFVFPWPSEGWLRLPTQQAPWRAAVYLIRTAADMSLLLFIAQYLFKTRRPDLVVKYTVMGTSIAALGGAFQYLTQIDPYDLVTGLSSMPLRDRMRGLNYEPRGLGLVAAHGFLLSLMLYSHRRSLKRLGIVALHGIAIFLSVSTSSLFAVAAGALALFMSHKRSRGPLVAITCAILLFSVLLLHSGLSSPWVDTWSYNLQLRLTSNKLGSTPSSWPEEFALRLDIFDASALAFLLARPTYLVVGAGPGLITLPATSYIPKAAVFDWVWQQGSGLNTVPHTGLLREVSDAGIVGLLLWLIVVLSCARALSALHRGEGSAEGPWSVGRSAFFVATAIYCVQASPLSAIWPLFIGIGLAARVLQECPRLRVRSPVPVQSLRKLPAAGISRRPPNYPPGA